MNTAAEKPAVLWKLLGVLAIGLAAFFLLDKLLLLALLAGLSFLAIGMTAAMIRRQPVDWKHVRENGMAAADGLARGCRWACVQGQQKAQWVWHEGGPAVRRGVEACWQAGRRRMQRLGGVALEAFSGAGLGALAGLALMFGGVADSAIPICTLLGGAFGFAAGVFWSRPATVRNEPEVTPTLPPT